jgi:hypothetical protein
MPLPVNLYKNCTVASLAIMLRGSRWVLRLFPLDSGSARESFTNTGAAKATMEHWIFMIRAVLVVFRISESAATTRAVLGIFPLISVFYCFL